MNTRQLQYAIELARVKNFSQVAESLSISQPALSKQILSLEQELGVKLFDRSTNPLTLTAAGDSFLGQAKELVYRQEQLEASMAQFRSGEAGRLVIGISPFRTLYLIPGIAKKLRERFPGVQIFLHEAGSDVLRKEAAEGKYDFAILNLPVDASVLDVICLEPDTLALAVPKDLLHRIPQAVPGEELDLKECRDLPFITVGRGQELRVLFDRLCAQAEFIPHIVMETVGLTTAWAMVNGGIGAAVLPLQFLSHSAFRQDIAIFPLKNTGFSRQPAIVTRRGKYLSEYAKYAIDLLSKK